MFNIETSLVTHEMSTDQSQADAAEPTVDDEPAIPSETPVEAVESGDSLTVIFSREETKNVMIQLVSLFALIGVVVGIVGYLAAGQAVDGDAGFAIVDEEVVVGSILLGSVAVAPALGVVLSLRANGLLSGVRDDFTLASAAVGSGVGTLVLLVIAAVLTTVPVDDVGVADFGVITITLVVLTAVIGAASVWVARHLH